MFASHSAGPLRKAAGSKLNRKAFRGELLADGGMPLAVLERELDAWAASVK